MPADANSCLQYTSIPASFFYVAGINLFLRFNRFDDVICEFYFYFNQLSQANVQVYEFMSLVWLLGAGSIFYLKIYRQ